MRNRIEYVYVWGVWGRGGICGTSIVCVCVCVHAYSPSSFPTIMLKDLHKPLVHINSILTNRDMSGSSKDRVDKNGHKRRIKAIDRRQKSQQCEPNTYNAVECIVKANE